MEVDDAKPDPPPVTEEPTTVTVETTPASLDPAPVIFKGEISIPGSQVDVVFNYEKPDSPDKTDPTVESEVSTSLSIFDEKCSLKSTPIEKIPIQPVCSEQSPIDQSITQQPPYIHQSPVIPPNLLTQHPTFIHQNLLNQPNPMYSQQMQQSNGPANPPPPPFSPMLDLNVAIQTVCAAFGLDVKILQTVSLCKQTSNCATIHFCRSPSCQPTVTYREEQIPPRPATFDTPPPDTHLKLEQPPKTETRSISKQPLKTETRPPSSPRPKTSSTTTTFARGTSRPAPYQQRPSRSSNTPVSSVNLDPGMGVEIRHLFTRRTDLTTQKIPLINRAFGLLMRKYSKEESIQLVKRWLTEDQSSFFHFETGPICVFHAHLGIHHRAGFCATKMPWSYRISYGILNALCLTCFGRHSINTRCQPTPCTECVDDTRNRHSTSGCVILAKKMNLYDKTTEECLRDADQE